MNNIQASSALDIIFSDSKIGLNNKKCILIDGNWGIGKTYFVHDYFKNNNKEYELIYISVFGKDSIKDIEKSMLFNLIPGLKNVKNNSIGVKVAKTLFNDMGDKFLGVSVENYVNSFSIEDVKWASKEKRIVICIDDIERKTESIEMKSLLGLIERASRNFDIIMIGNTNEIFKHDKDIFLKYKEKVVDHIIEFNKLNKSILDTILDTIMDNRCINLDEKDEIIDMYLEGNTGFGRPRFSDKDYKTHNIYNLRVFLKYIELIVRVKGHLVNNQLDKDVLEICKAVIYDYYFSKREVKRRSMNFDKYNIYKTISKIFLNEKIEIREFEAYLIANSEVKTDIRKIYNAYKLNETEFNNLIKKINQKAESRDKQYFIEQENVISIFNAISEVSQIDNRLAKSLFKTAVDLYDAKEGFYKKIEYSIWNSMDEYGNEIECKESVKKFIDDINKECKEKYEKHILIQLEESYINKNYEQMLFLLKSNELNDTKYFLEIFEYYYNQLIIKYSEPIVENIQNLIDKTQGEIVIDCLNKKKKDEDKFTGKKKIDYFIEYLDKKLESEARLEYEIQQAKGG